MRHPWTWGICTSSGDVRGGAAPSLHVTLPGALATQRCWRLGLRIVEVPILFEERRAGYSKMDWRIVAEALLLVWALRFGSEARRETQPWAR